jgi:hypothetical protein
VGLCYKVIFSYKINLGEINRDVEDQEYMLIKPTHYMLENPMYLKEEKEQEEVKQDSYGEIHCFMDRKERKCKDQKLKLKFEADDM